MPTLASHAKPTLASISKGFKLPTTDNGTFEIKPSYINLVEINLFGGGATEDPATHMERFVTYCCSIPLTAGVTQDQVKQVLFPFYLRDGATEWLRDLDMEDQGVTDWNSLALSFYKRYFPPQKTNALRNQITSFKQGPTEDLNEAWIRFKRLVRSVPHHGFQKWFLCNQFNNGLYDDHRALLDSSANGRFQDNTNDNNAWKLIDQIATHTAKYGNPRGSTRGGSSSDGAVAAQLETLIAQIAELKTAQSLGNQQTVHAFQSFKQGTPYSNFYNERTREHPNFSYRSQNVLNPTPPPPQGLNQTYTIPQNRGNQPQGGYQRNNQGGQQHLNNDLSDIKAMLQQQMAASQKQEALITQLMAHNKMLDNQIAQLSTSSRQPGTPPSQPEKPHDTANTIHLRSGLTYDGPVMPESVEEIIIEKLDMDAEEKAADEDALIPEKSRSTEISGRSTKTAEQKIGETENSRSTEKSGRSTEKSGRSSDLVGRSTFSPDGVADPSSIAIVTPSTTDKASISDKGKSKVADPPIVIKVPFPGCLKNTKVEQQFGKFLEVVKNLQVTVPFTELITQVPSYAKFMKDILTRTHVIDKALCDLGASVSVMPYSVCKKLNMRHLKVTNVTLQMADRTVKRSLGVLEDVPVKIGKFFIPVDFIVLDMAEDTQIPIILGRPFLHTVGGIIDVKQGPLTLEVGDDSVTLNLASTLAKPMIEDTCYAIDIVDESMFDY
ncbi:uncharacterized protein LOC141607445 [Silene latifolia]|uniref:uncharacterized protein LOC141607445 n=1 Tax=Silene latifolia TaxID=37657 RepID=UPI003D7765AF